MEPLGDRLAEEILPREVWNMAFGFLDNPEDVQRCYQTCTLFQSILQPKVFSQALGLVHARAGQSGGPIRNRDILSLRRVSRQSRQMVDHYLQSRPSRLDLSCYRNRSIAFQNNFKEQGETAPNNTGAISLKLHRLQDARHLVQQITSERRVSKGNNVLCGRHLVVMDAYGKCTESPETLTRNKEQFHQVVSTLLEACGTQIWYLTLDSLIIRDLTGWYVNIFSKWLQLLPNLKMFTGQITLDYEERMSQARAIGEFPGVIEKHPFPKMPLLVTLQLTGAPHALLHSALNQNPHVRNLEIQPFFYRYPFALNFNLWRDVQLTEFCITISHFFELDHLVNSGWPLQKLTLSFFLGPFPLSAVEGGLERLEHFGETLKYLRVAMPGENQGTPSNQWRLRLPHLEEFHLHLKDQATLDFMLVMVSLKKFKLSMVATVGQGMSEINLEGSSCPLTNLYESNIWGLIPSLWVIEVQINFHLRREDIGLVQERPPQTLTFHRKGKYV